MQINYPIENIIGDVVEACKDMGSISIVETATGIYTCTIPEYELLLDNHYVTISGTTNFNGSFLISNLTDTTFTINTTAGFETEIGTYTAEFPYYTFEKWTGLTNILQDLTQNITTQPKRFPRLFLQLDISERYIKSYLYEANNINLFFVINSEQNKKSDWRLENTMEYLMKFYRLFYQNLKSSKYTHLYFEIEHTRIKHYYNFTQKTDQNVINSLVDVIEMNIPTLLIDNYTCN